MGRTALFSRNQPGGVFTIADIEQHPGEIYFVDSAAAGAADAVGYGLNPDKPFATLAYAFSSDVLVSGDVVYVMPSHAETIAAAAGIACDIAGVRVIGLGWGAARPTFTFSATDSTWTISAASVGLKNIRVKSSIAEMVKMFVVSAAHATLDAVDVVDATTNTVIQFLLTTAAADDLTIKNCTHYSLTVAAAAQIWIELVGADRARILDNHFCLNLKNATGVYSIASTGTACLNILIARNRIYQVGGNTQTHFINLVASTTGHVTDNRIAGNVDALAASLTLASCYAAENYVTTTVDKSGIIDPVVA